MTAIAGTHKNEAHVYDVIIIGGGLTGLTAACMLHDAGRSVLILEAAARAGGRIRSMREPQSNTYLADLGPTWVWPEAQPLAAAWLERLGLATEPQFERGDTMVEQSATTSPVRYPLPGMHGSRRIAGGTESIISRLLENIPNHAVKTKTRVTSVSLINGCAEVVTENASHPLLHARRIIAAVPLRIAASAMTWSPPLDDRRHQRHDSQRPPGWRLKRKQLPCTRVPSGASAAYLAASPAALGH